MINRTDVERENAVIQAFLALLDQDIQVGVNVRPLPEDLAQSMQAQAPFCRDIDLNEEIEGDVDL